MEYYKPIIENKYIRSILLMNGENGLKVNKTDFGDQWRKVAETENEDLSKIGIDYHISDKRHVFEVRTPMLSIGDIIGLHGKLHLLGFGYVYPEVKLIDEDLEQIDFKAIFDKYKVDPNQKRGRPRKHPKKEELPRLPFEGPSPKQEKKELLKEPQQKQKQKQRRRDDFGRFLPKGKISLIEKVQSKLDKLLPKTKQKKKLERFLPPYNPMKGGFDMKWADNQIENNKPIKITAQTFSDVAEEFIEIGLAILQLDHLLRADYTNREKLFMAYNIKKYLTLHDEMKITLEQAKEKYEKIGLKSESTTVEMLDKFTELFKKSKMSETKIDKLISELEKDEDISIKSVFLAFPNTKNDAEIFKNEKIRNEIVGKIKGLKSQLFRLKSNFKEEEHPRAKDGKFATIRENKEEKKKKIEQEINKLSKKLKKHERDVLMPLYEKQATYLLRAIKTASEIDRTFDIDKFIDKIPSYIDDATCHEIAINSSSHTFSLETHETPLGVEDEYTRHPKAKRVSRNKRVKIIWGMIEKELVDNPELEGYEMYSDEELNAENKDLFSCPQCGETIAGQDRNTGDIDWDYDGCSCLRINDNTGQFSEPWMNEAYFDSEILDILTEMYSATDFDDHIVFEEKASNIIQDYMRFKDKIVEIRNIDDSYYEDKDTGSEYDRIDEITIDFFNNLYDDYITMKDLSWFKLLLEDEGFDEDDDLWKKLIPQKETTVKSEFKDEEAEIHEKDINSDEE